MAKSFTHKKIKYVVISEDKACIALNPNASGCIEIPEIIEKNGIVYRVVEMVDSCFEKSGICSVSLPQTISKISWYAFHDCKSLTSVILPDNITSIEGSAFRGCINLETIQIPMHHISYGEKVFEGTKWLNDKFSNHDYVILNNSLVGVKPNLQGDIILPQGINRIPSGAFQDYIGITSITLPEGISAIGDHAFGGCVNLRSINIPSTVSTIGSGAFMKCYNLESISFPLGLSRIGYAAFSKCNKIRSIQIPSSITQIDSFAFQDCYSLTNVSVPDTKFLGDNVFKDCPNIGKDHLETSPYASLSLITDVYELHCFSSILEIDTYSQSNFNDPEDNGYDPVLISFFNRGQFRSLVNDDSKEIIEGFFCDMDDTHTNSELELYFDSLPLNSYCIFDRYEVYKANWNYRIQLEGAPFNLHLMGFSFPDRIPQSLSMSSYGEYEKLQRGDYSRELGPFFMTDVYYAGHKVSDTEFDSDLGTRGDIVRFIFYKGSDGVVSHYKTIKYQDIE